MNICSNLTSVLCSLKIRQWAMSDSDVKSYSILSLVGSLQILQSSSSWKTIAVMIASTPTARYLQT